MHVIEVRDGELLGEIARQARELRIVNAAIVTLIGAVDSFTVSVMEAADPTRDIVTECDLPGEMSGTGEIVDGKPHVHAMFALEGERVLGGHVRDAEIVTSFVRAYVVPITENGP
jgi:uncharacterized protein